MLAISGARHDPFQYMPAIQWLPSPIPLFAHCFLAVSTSPKKKKKNAKDTCSSAFIIVKEEQLEEAMQVLEAELDFKQRSIQDKQEKVCGSALGNSARVSDVTEKLRALSQSQASELLVKYFSKVRAHNSRYHFTAEPTQNVALSLKHQY